MSRAATGRRRRPLYARVLRLRHLRPGGVTCVLLFEGSVCVGALLALAELTSWWSVPALPATVALMVKVNDVVAGLSRWTVPGRAGVPRRTRPVVPGPGGGSGRRDPGPQVPRRPAETARWASIYRSTSVDTSDARGGWGLTRWRGRDGGQPGPGGHLRSGGHTGIGGSGASVDGSTPAGRGGPGPAGRSRPPSPYRMDHGRGANQRRFGRPA